VHAFEELLQGIHTFIEVQEDRGAAPSVMIEVQSVCTKTRLLRDRVSEILQGSQYTMPTVLPESAQFPPRYITGS
jgi:midasin